MDFEFTEEQRQLADSLKKYLAANYSFETRKTILQSASGQSQPAWSAFADMGLTALPFAEEVGGLGGGAVDMIAAMEAFGEALVVEPLLDHVGLATRLIAQAGTPAQRDAVLPQLLDGSAQAAFASLEPGRRYALEPVQTLVVKDPASADPAAPDWLLDGAKTMVVGAAFAKLLVVSAQISHGAGCPVSGGVGLFLVDPAAPGVSISAYRTVDGLRAADLRFTGVRLPRAALLGGPDVQPDAMGQLANAMPQIEEAVDFATALLCADAVGAMKSATDATLQYTQERKQFGIAIASFQALQHRMVEMFMACEEARSMAISAACRVDAAQHAEQGATGEAAVRTRKKAVSAAAVKVIEAARKVSQESVQLHGGMGMTEELKVSHTFRRLTASVQRFGDADHHLARYAEMD
jgi:alkylation response protein AidB-like acyl-CoA dehydrogenase